MILLVSSFLLTKRISFLSLIKNCNRNLKKAILELETLLLIKTQKKTINQTKIDSIIKLILKKKNYIECNFKNY